MMTSPLAAMDDTLPALRPGTRTSMTAAFHDVLRIQGSS